MTLVNETQQEVSYWISCDAVGANCGDIPVDGLVDLPAYDNQTNVYVGFRPSGGVDPFTMNVLGDKFKGEQIEMALIAE